MSADIQKEAVFDDRIVQQRPRYAVEKGALSVTNAPFNAISANASSMTFNIYVPSENVFVDRAIRWTGQANFQMTVTQLGITTGASTGASNAATAGYVGASGLFTNPPYVSPGQDFSLSPFPLNYLCQTMTATINDTTSVINTQDVLLEVMRLTDYKRNLLQRTCPTKMDKYAANYVGSPYALGNAAQVQNNPISGYGDALNVDEVPNGAHPGFFWTDASGNRLIAGANNGNYGWGTSNWCYNGCPVVSVGNVASNTLYFQITSTELLTLSPFVFANDCEDDTGLFGINNIQLVMNFKNGLPLTRILKTLGTAQFGAVATPSNYYKINSSSIQFNQTNPWSAAVMNVQFLTPSLDVPLPAKSVVPYMEFPRYITAGAAQSSSLSQTGNTISALGIGQIQSQTITLPQIPDLLIIYCKPQGTNGTAPDPQDPSFCDFYLPPASQFVSGTNAVKNPLSINFDNFSGLLSSHTTEELYRMSVSNGLEMPWATWCGQAVMGQQVGGDITGFTAITSNVITTSNYYPPYQAGARVPTTGGFLVLKPSKDITLQPGQAPSLVGNFTLQFNLTVFNPMPFAVTPVLYVITANSGYFESIRGSSRIIKGVLSEQDIISAPVAATQTRSELHRMVGSGFRKMFGNVLGLAKKAHGLYKEHKDKIHGAVAGYKQGGLKGAVKGAMKASARMDEGDEE